MKRSASLLLPLVAAVPASAMELNSDNFFEMTDGKTIFLKFFAPWCGHCKALKPDWDKLIEDFAGSETQLIADVDCTADGEKLCEEHGVQGFPTLKWGDPSDLQDYNGARSYEDLKKFADENLKPMCSVKNVDLCDDDKKALIEKLQAMSLEDLEAEAEKEEAKIEAADERFEKEVEKLQEAYEELTKERDDAVAAVKASGLGLMNSVMKMKEATKETKEDVKDEL